jgi:hypothetical protein
MKTLVTLSLLVLCAATASAQLDTLEYDGIINIFDGKLVALTRFPHETDVAFDARFTPVEKCTLRTVIVGFSVVKFQPLSGNDSLVVWVMENGNVPPGLVGLQKTYKVDLGGNGFPNPNINIDDPLQSGDRGVMAVTLDPPVVFAPKRDFIIAVKIAGIQQYATGPATWNGFTIMTSQNVPEFDRYRRYSMTKDAAGMRNDLATTGGNVGLFIRAVVFYDRNLPDTVDVVGTDATPAPAMLALAPNYPNPFNPSTTLRYALPVTGHARLAVTDALGREVAVLAEGVLDAGTHEARFNAAALPSGLYMARLVSGGAAVTRSMLLTK